MAYGKRRYSRRFYRRRKMLSTRNIFNNKSARSQASQIYRLNRRVSALSKANRPEVKVKYQIAERFRFTSDQLTNTYKGFNVYAPGLSEDGSGRIGDMINIKNAQLNFMFEYFNDSQTGFHDTESSGSPVRIIIGQFKSSVNQSVPSFSSILEEVGGSGAAYTNMALSPLKANVTDDHYILFDKTYTITSMRNQLVKRINIKPKNYRFNANTTYNCIWVYVIAPGLHYDENFKETVQCVYSAKIAYTDP